MALYNFFTFYWKAWKDQDEKASKAGVKKIDLHTDYCSGRNAILALASDAVDDETKAKMAAALLEQPKVDIPKGKPVAPRILDRSELPDFINSESWLFFKVKVKSL